MNLSLENFSELPKFISTPKETTIVSMTISTNACSSTDWWMLNLSDKKELSQLSKQNNTPNSSGLYGNHTTKHLYNSLQPKA